MADVQAVVVGGKLYVPGGRLESGEASPQLEIYDPVNDQWSQGAPMQVPASGYSLVEYEGKLYLFGGVNSSGILSSVQVYDPDPDEWIEKSSLPDPVAFSGAAPIDGKIYILGGYDGKQVVDQVVIYSPAMDDGKDNPWSSAGRGRPA